MNLPMMGAGQKASGMEHMLRSFGLGEVLDAAKKLASDGSIEKIIAFADGVEELNGRLATIERLLIELHRGQSEQLGIASGSDTGGTLPPAAGASVVVSPDDGAD